MLTITKSNNNEPNTVYIINERAAVKRGCPELPQLTINLYIGKTNISKIMKKASISATVKAKTTNTSVPKRYSAQIWRSSLLKTYKKHKGKMVTVKKISHEDTESKLAPKTQPSKA